MKSEILSQHIKFFQKHKFIEFEDVFSKEKMQKLYGEMQKHLETKINRPFLSLSFIETFKNGRDLWRSSDTALSIIKEKAILEILHLLCNKNTFRIGFDQIIKTSEEDKLDDLFQSGSLEEITSFRPLIAGVLICVKNEKEIIENQDLIFPQKVGNILIIDPSFSMPLQSLIKVKNSLYYLIGYVPIRCQYVENKADLLTNDCKQYGYGFGDSLKDKFHPIIQLKK